jgi:hypothetical protein
MGFSRLDLESKMAKGERDGWLKGATTFSIITLSITTLSITKKRQSAQHLMLIVVTLRALLVKCIFSKWYAEWRYNVCPSG